MTIEHCASRDPREYGFARDARSSLMGLLAAFRAPL